MSNPEPLSPFPVRAVMNVELDGRMKAYVFVQGDWYNRVDWATDRADPDCYKPVEGNWNFPSGWSSIRACVRGAGEPAGCVTLFNGSQLAHYNPDSDEVVAGPMPISKGIPGIPADFAKGIDGALEGRGEYSAYIYLFRGGRYLRLVRGGKLDPNQSVRGLEAFIGKGRWGAVDTVFNGEGKWSNIAYFVRGVYYLRYNWTTDRIDGPLLLAANWPALVPNLFHYFPVDPETDVNTRIVDIVYRCDRISHVRAAHRLGALVARGVDPPDRNIGYATNCGTTAAGVLVAALGSLAVAGKIHGHLIKSYVPGSAIAILRDIGRLGNAWLPVTRSVRPEPCPEPGDLLFYARGNNEHVEWLLSPVEYRQVGNRELPFARHGGGGRDVKIDPNAPADQGLSGEREAVAKSEATIAKNQKELADAKAALASVPETDAVALAKAKARVEKAEKALQAVKFGRGRMMTVSEPEPIHENSGRPLLFFLSIRTLLAARGVQIP